MTKLSAEAVFRLHPKIRFVGLSSKEGEVVFSEQRNGTATFSPAEADRAFVQMGSLILMGVCERLSPWTGPVGSVVINYEKVLSVVMRVKDGYLAMTLEKGEAPDTIAEIVRSVRSLAGSA
jgi:hypothetical protein